MTKSLIGVRMLQNPELVICEGHEINRLRENEDSFLNLLEHNESVRVITSDGHWVSTLRLPDGAPYGARITVLRDSEYITTIEYNQPTATLTPARGSSIEFIKLDRWHICSVKEICGDSILHALAEDDKTVSEALSQYGVIKILFEHASWVGTFKIPPAREVDIDRRLIFERNSMLKVELAFNSCSIFPGRDTCTQFKTNSKRQWELVPSMNIIDNRNLEQISEPENIRHLLRIHSSLGILFRENSYLDIVELPMDVSFGDLVLLKNTSKNLVKVKAGDQTFTVLEQSEIIFYFDRFTWNIININE